MGRTVPTFRKIIKRAKKRWKEFRKALRKSEKKAFDKMIEHCRNHTSASSQVKDPEPFRSMLISILLEHQKEIDSIEKKIDEILDNLEDEKG